MEIINYKNIYLKKCRSLWAEMVQVHRDIYSDPSIGGENPGHEFDNHLKKVGPEKVWVAQSDSRIVGLAALIHRGLEAEVEPVIVASHCRGQGIGARLIRHITSVAKELGVMCLSVKPVARNEGAISFFYASGFKTLGHIQMFMWLNESEPGVWIQGPSIFEKSFFM